MLSYKKGSQSISAVAVAKHFPDVVQWLLVERFVDQPKLELPKHGRSVCTGAETTISSGTTTTGLVLEDETVAPGLDLVFLENVEAFLNRQDRLCRNRFFQSRSDGSFDIQELVFVDN